MKTFRKIATALLVIGTVVATFFACDKENEKNNTLPTNEGVTGKPIGAKDLNTGLFTYGFSIDDLQKAIDYKTSQKGQTNRYIIENLEIEENAFEFDTVSLTAIKIVFLDVEMEQSITQWLFGGFVEEVIMGQSKYYYLGNEILDGDYSFISSGTQNFKYSIQNETVLSVETATDDDLCYGAVLPWNLICTTGPNCTGCSRHNTNHTFGGWGCDCDNGNYEPDGRFCTTGTDPGNTIGLIGIIVTIISFFV